MRSKIILNNIITVREFTICAFKLCYKDEVIRATWYQNKSSYINHWKRNEEPDIVPNLYRCLIFDKEAFKKPYNGDKRASTMVLDTLDI